LLRLWIHSQFLHQLQILFHFDGGCDVCGDVHDDSFRDRDVLINARVEQVSDQGLI